MKTFDLTTSNTDELFKMMANRSQMDIPEVNRIVSDILAAVRERGDEAVLEYTSKFDKVNIDDIQVSQKELDEAWDNTPTKLLDIIKKALANITNFHEKQKETSWVNKKEDGSELGFLVRPIGNVGIYVPGGSAPLISSVLMNVIPAKVAGVKRIVMATPPGPDGKINPAVLVAAQLAGAHEVYKMGGAQAIGALAFGTATIKRVDKIFGPGNIYVATAKRMVFGYCGIDSFAGPSEVTVVADDTANPRFVAADMLSQAEHDPLACAILITPSNEVATSVLLELQAQLKTLPRQEIAAASLEGYGAVVIVKDMDQAIEIVNAIAPEHLELCVENPKQWVPSIQNAGAIFLGNYSPEPLGDYFAGPNHVLPTGGTARFFSPLNVGDFIKRTSLIYYTEETLKNCWEDVATFAEAEELCAHANAMKVRFQNPKALGAE